MWRGANKHKHKPIVYMYTRAHGREVRVCLWGWGRAINSVFPFPRNGWRPENSLGRGEGRTQMGVGEREPYRDVETVTEENNTPVVG